jgi:hypothetical protein
METRTALLEQLRGCPKWLATLPADRFDMAMRARGISAPAAEARVALASLKVEEPLVKKSDVKVGGEYVAKVSDKLTTVKITGESRHGGWDAKNVKTGKEVRIKSAQRLRGSAATPKEPAKGAEAAPKAGNKPCGTCTNCRNGAPQLCQGAHVAAPVKGSAKTTKATRGRNVGQRGAPQPARRNLGEGGAKEKRVGLVDAAITILHEAGNKPMNVKEIIEVVLAKKLWSTTGKTPAATLYSCILREIQKKGSEARFKKVERGQFALNG